MNGMYGLNAFERLTKVVYWSRLSRLKQHYVAIKSELRPRGKELEEVIFFTNRFEYYSKKTNRLINVRFVFYLLLYATLVINIVKLIPFLSFLGAVLGVGSALFGSTVAFVVIFLLTLRINLNLELMHDCLTHLIVIYHKNPKRKSSVVIAKIAKAI